MWPNTNSINEQIQIQTFRKWYFEKRDWIVSDEIEDEAEDLTEEELVAEEELVRYPDSPETPHVPDIPDVLETTGSPAPTNRDNVAGDTYSSSRG